MCNGTVVRVGVQWYCCEGGCAAVLSVGWVCHGTIGRVGVQWYYR